ncbi:hypothetical protein [Paenibacillus naphthalenovorans]|uniref:Uncharacterized protein n=1 Tax=Paenibacillus naphthalenovorans TaxID=162209 RepID=A0A0U2M439_9BACL|nr:hypothetical protein [Paenibacillus naphthalenovorans]ALS22288.1 hypothetical protein IJ22_19140 [Paenibacillus naphthalenovorans]
MGKSSRLNWQDVYYDGTLKDYDYAFCEETERIFKHKIDEGWDSIEELELDYLDDLGDDTYKEWKREYIKKNRN